MFSAWVPKRVHMNPRFGFMIGSVLGGLRCQRVLSFGVLWGAAVQVERLRRAGVRQNVSLARLLHCV